MASPPGQKPPRGPTSRDFIGRLYAPLYERPRAKPVPPAFFLGKDPTGRPVGFSPEMLSTHLHIVGGSGKGKSNLLRRLVQQLVARCRTAGEGFAIIDPHGTFAQYALDACATDAALLAPKIVHFDLRQLEKVLVINPLRRSGDPYFVASCIKEALLKTFGESRAHDKPLISRVLGNLVEALLHTGLALTDFRYFLYRGQADRAVFRHLVEQLPPGDLRSFWENFDLLPPAQADAYTMGPSNRLEPLVKSSVIRRVLGQTDAGLDFQALMDDGGIAIFDLSREGTGVTVDGQHILAALLVQEFRQVFESRRPDDSRPFTLILDEFGDYTSADFARVLTAARKFGLRCVFSHQHMGQMLLDQNDRTLFDAVLAIPNKVIFGGLPQDQAELLAKQVYLRVLDPDKIQFQPKTITWDPIPTLVRLHASGFSRSDADATGESATRTVIDDPDGGRQSAADALQWTFTSQRGWTESEHEAWTTFYRMRVQNYPPMLEDLETQVFRFAKALNLNPMGTCVIATADDVPVECRVPHMKTKAVSPTEMALFKKLFYDKPVYLDAAEADRRIEARQARLVQDAPPAEGRIKRRRPKDPPESS